MQVHCGTSLRSAPQGCCVSSTQHTADHCWNEAVCCGSSAYICADPAAVCPEGQAGFKPHCMLPYRPYHNREALELVACGSTSLHVIRSVVDTATKWCTFIAVLPAPQLVDLRAVYCRFYAPVLRALLCTAVGLHAAALLHVVVLHITPGGWGLVSLCVSRTRSTAWIRMLQLLYWCVCHHALYVGAAHHKSIYQSRVYA